MAACSFTGTPDLYGAGIRAGFYVLWFGVILTTWLAPREVAELRRILLLYSLAVFLAVVIAASTPGGNPLRPVETYLGLLLAAGADYYALLPLYLWRLVTGCSPYWDPARWPRVPPAGRIARVLRGMFVLALALFQLWFWADGVHTGASAAAAEDCPRPYGFFLARVPLLNDLFIGGNMVVALLVLLGCTVRIGLGLGLARPPRCLRKKRRRAARRGVSDMRRSGLALVDGVVRAGTAALVVTAVELTITWNDIVGVSGAGTAAQLVPLAVAVGMVARALWVAGGGDGGNDSTEASDEDGGRSSSSDGEGGQTNGSRRRQSARSHSQRG